ncbi:MAG: hypothetical protein ACLQJR_10660 [Stellaceae bacterium]
MTQALTISPRSASGDPTTGHSCVAGCSMSAVSTFERPDAIGAAAMPTMPVAQNLFLDQEKCYTRLRGGCIAA